MTYTINSTTFPAPAAWEESYETIENVSQSEAGTDLCSLIRANKLTISITNNVNSEQKESLRALAAEPTVSVSVNGGSPKTMRMRGFTASRVRYSEKNIIDLWTCKYTLTEV